MMDTEQISCLLLEQQRAEISSLRKKLRQSTDDLITFGVDLSEDDAEEAMLVDVPPILTPFPRREKTMSWKRYDNNPPGGPLESALFDWKKGNWFGTHYHNEQETLSIRRGKITLYVLIDTKTKGFVLEKGDTYVIPACARHNAYCNDDAIIIASYEPPMPHHKEVKWGTLTEASRKGNYEHRNE